MKNQEIKVEELKQMLNEGKKVVVLDIRSIDQRNEFQIDQSIHRDVYSRLIEGDTTVFEHDIFDKETLIVTVCNAGKTSLLASTLLNSIGYNALSLQGGIKAWIQAND